MKFLKHFESSKQFREVDLQKLWNDFIEYKKELFPDKIFTGDQFRNEINLLSNFFCINILNPLLKNKEVEFHKTQSTIDDEVRFGFEGRIRHITIEPSWKQSNQLIVIVDLQREFKEVKLGTLQNVILAKIVLRYSGFITLYPNVVRIYNSLPTEIEDKINMLNNVEKYNL